MLWSINHNSQLAAPDCSDGQFEPMDESFEGYLECGIGYYRP